MLDLVAMDLGDEGKQLTKDLVVMSEMDLLR